MNHQPQVGMTPGRGWGSDSLRSDQYGLELTDDVYGRPYQGSRLPTEDSTIVNAATCPDCSGGMIRQGGCQFCPECGYESCHVT